MDRENLSWGEERIADESLLKRGIRVSPRTVGKYLESGKPLGTSGERWSTFVRNHSKEIVACDLFTSVTAAFRVLKTPRRALQANAYCERLIGTIRRDCLDFLIPLGETHLKSILGEYMRYYNRGRPHSAIGPGIPEPSKSKTPAGPHRHKLPNGLHVTSSPILSGLHHEYGRAKEVA
jgi:hypothetical protein